MAGSFFFLFVLCCTALITMQFFESCGWQLLVRYSLSQATTAYGWNVVHTPASRVRTDSQEVQYVVGVVMK